MRKPAKIGVVLSLAALMVVFASQSWLTGEQWGAMPRSALPTSALAALACLDEPELGRIAPERLPRGVRPADCGASFRAWLRHRDRYNKAIEQEWGFVPLPVVQAARSHPVASLESALSLDDLLSRGVLATDTATDALLLIPGKFVWPESAPLRPDSGVAATRTIRETCTEAYQVAAGVQSSVELAELAIALATLVSQTGYKRDGNNLLVYPYDLGWRFRPERPLAANGLVHDSLATDVSAYRAFRALCGEAYDARPWTEAQHRQGGHDLTLRVANLDVRGLCRAADLVLRICAPDLLTQVVEEWEDRESVPHVPGVEGGVLAYFAGQPSILIGGSGANRYSGRPADVIVDLGGPDVYEDVFVCGDTSHPLSVIIDVSGDDEYSTTGVGGPGAGIGGVGVLFDGSGNDVYRQGVTASVENNTCWSEVLTAGGLDSGFCYGAALVGVGIAIDAHGNDEYAAVKWAQGAALGPGLGLLVDFQGSDRYLSGALAAGVGINKGCGILVDRGNGDDFVRCGGLFPTVDPRKNPRGGMRPRADLGWMAMGMGAGSAWRGELSSASELRGWPTYGGGLGVLFNEDGNDVYEGASYAIASGYSGGCGFLVDRAGNDRYQGFKGSAYDIATGCHRGTGVLLDRRGDDLYQASLPCGGYGWDLSIGLLVDERGQDQYDLRPTADFPASQAAAYAVGILVDGTGPDRVSAESEGLGIASYLPSDYVAHGGNICLALFFGQERDALPRHIGQNEVVSCGQLPDRSQIGGLPVGVAVVVAEGNK
jgi:hypothetical protein